MKEKIKIFLKQNWFRLIIIVLILVIMGGYFYWFEWRPNQIRKECANKIIETSKGKNLSTLSTNDLLIALEFCLQMKGLK